MDPLPQLRLAQVAVCAAVLCIASVGAVAQPAQRVLVIGQALDDSTGHPIPGVNVFVPESTIGSAADVAGRFALRPLPGPGVEIEASAVGYDGASVAVDLSPGDTVRVVFRLRPASLSLAGISVTARMDRNRERALEALRAALIGTTSNARAVQIENGEVLRLDFRRRRHLRAEGEAPLVLRNDALGYNVTVHGLALVADRRGRDWSGRLQFSDACGQACPGAVDSARHAAYHGSLLHFLRATAVGQLQSEGFEARFTRGTPNSGFFAANETFGRSPEAQREGDEWVLPVARALRVTYTGDNGKEVSWLEAEGGELRFTAGGRLLNGREVVRHGRWDVERIADRLPFDYGLPQD